MNMSILVLRKKIIDGIIVAELYVKTTEYETEWEYICDIPFDKIDILFTTKDVKWHTEPTDNEIDRHYNEIKIKELKAELKKCEDNLKSLKANI
jgi:hypothetical protein